MDLSEIEQLKSDLAEKRKQVIRLEMQVKLAGNLAKELERQKGLALEAQEEVK